MDFFKKLALRIYIKMFGINFYYHDIYHDSEFENTLTIRYLESCEVKFYFYKTKIDYYYYILNTLIKRQKIVYTVSANFCDKVDSKLNKLKKLKLHVYGPFFFLVNNDGFLYEYLTKVFLECLAHEMENENIK